MNILHFYKDYYPVLGGIENHIKVLAEAQVAAGHQVTVLVCDPGRRTRTEPCNGVPPGVNILAFQLRNVLVDHLVVNIGTEFKMRLGFIGRVGFGDGVVVGFFRLFFPTIHMKYTGGYTKEY